MDRFIFRGKRLDNNQWTYGFLSFIYTNGKNENGLIYTDKARMYCPEDCCGYDIYLKTVGQCSGVSDKNKKLIFDGDIVKRQNRYIGIVIFEKGCFKIKWQDGVYYGWARHIDDYQESSLEIIGNIYENPELLETKQNEQ